MANQNHGSFVHLKHLPVIAGEILLIQIESPFERSICDFKALTHL